MHVDQQIAAECRYLIEVKAGKNPKLGELLKYLDEGMDAYGATAGIVVLNRQEHAPTVVPLAQLGNRFIVILDEDEPDETALKVAMTAARLLSIPSSTLAQHQLDAKAVHQHVERIVGEVANLDNSRKRFDSIRKSAESGMNELDAVRRKLDTELSAIKGLVQP